MATAKLSEPTVYRNWIQSVLPQSSPPIHDLTNDAKELLLLRVFEALRPGVLDWKRIDGKPGNFYKKLSNLTILFEAMREQGIVVLSVRPADVLEGKESALFAILWNFMRVYFHERVSPNNEVDESALVEWANNFKSCSWLPTPCEPDEVISGSDKDFFYCYSMDEEVGVLKAVQQVRKEAPKVAGNFEGAERSMPMQCPVFIDDFGPVERRDKLVLPRMMSLKKQGEKPDDAEQDIFEIVDMNFLSRVVIAEQPATQDKARQSLLNVSNLFGNIPKSNVQYVQDSLTKNSKLKDKEASPLLLVQQSTPNPNHETEDDPLIQRIVFKLSEQGLLQPAWMARFRMLLDLKKRTGCKLEVQTPPESPGPEGSEFDLATLLSEVRSDGFSQRTLSRARALSQTSKLKQTLDNLAVKLVSSKGSSIYPEGFVLSKEYRKVLYQTLKNGSSSAFVAEDIRKTAYQTFTSQKNHEKTPKNTSANFPQEPGPSW